MLSLKKKGVNQDIQNIRDIQESVYETHKYRKPGDITSHRNITVT